MPRTYSSPTRADDARRTRQAIVRASAKLFGRDGYGRTTMGDIAREAGVSVQTVHLAGPKAALLIAAFEVSFAGDEGRHGLSERPALVEIMARPRLDDALRGWLDYVARANDATASLVRAMTVAAETDELAAAAVADLTTRRRADLGRAAQWLISRGLLTEGDREQATDELNHLVGPETYAFFVTVSGWSPQRYRAWLDDAVRARLARWNPGAS